MKVCLIGANGLVASRHKKAWEALDIEWQGFDVGDSYNLAEYDLIDICTPPDSHLDLVRAAVQARKPVLCEKPIARTMQEADQFLTLGGKIGIIYQFRFNPKVLRLKKQIEKGKYGDIKMVISTYYRFRDVDYYEGWRGTKDVAGGGVVSNITIHYLDLMQWMFGYPVKITGAKNSTKSREVEDSAGAVLEFPNGTIGVFVSTTIANPQKHYEFTVIGTKGSKTIQLRQNEYHKENFQAFLNGKNYVTPFESIKSLQMALAILQ